MPALPDVPQVIKVRLNYAVEGDPSTATLLHYHYNTGAPDETDIQSFANAVFSNMVTFLAPEMTADKIINSAEVRDLSSPMGAVATSAGDPAPGTRSGTRLSPGTAALANYLVKRTYRGGKPRSYWPLGASADVASNGLWTDAFFAEYGTAVVNALNLNGGYGGLTIDYQCNVSYYGPPNRVITSGSTGRVRTVSTRRDAPGGTGAPIVDKIFSSAASKIIASQRRRNRNA